MANRLLTDTLSVPFDGAKGAEIVIDCGGGNLTLDSLPGEAGQRVLATGELQYYEEQGIPAHSINSERGRTTLALTAAATRRPGLPWFRLPWEACIWETEWRIHLNPTVPTDIVAHTGGGNVRLDLVGASVASLEADTGGGNVDVALPDGATNLRVTARSGAGNVTVAVGSHAAGGSTVDVHSGAGNVIVRVPRGLAARVHATSGIGRVTIPPPFAGAAGDIYQSPEYAGAVDRVEITAHSGAGNVTITTA